MELSHIAASGATATDKVMGLCDMLGTHSLTYSLTHLTTYSLTHSLTHSSGNNYEGYWHNDKKSGRGYMIWRDLDELYCGDWLNDLPHGNGEHIWGDSSSKLATRQLCNIYRGSFESGVRSGLGTFFYSNGSQYSGIYSLTHSLTYLLTRPLIQVCG